MSKSKGKSKNPPATSTKRARRAPPAERPDVGRIIENGFAMLMPFIVERIVATATAPERHAPAPDVPRGRDQNWAAYESGYRDGMHDGAEGVRDFVPFPVQDCQCEACRLLNVWADKFRRVAGVTGRVKS